MARASSQPAPILDSPSSAARASDRSSAERKLDLIAESVENLTHDLNNLLMGIATYTELALHGSTDSARREGFESRITEMTFDAIGIVRHLRSVATASNDEHRHVALVDLLGTALASARGGFRNRRAMLEAPSKLADHLVWVKPGEAIQAIVDLLDVARSSCAPTNRTVSLSLDDTHPDAVRIVVRFDGSIRDLERIAVLEDLARSAGAELETAEGGLGEFQLVLPRFVVEAP